MTRHVLFLLVTMMMASSTMSFQLASTTSTSTSTPHRLLSSPTTSSTQLDAAKSTTPKNFAAQAEFEYQELKIYLTAMKDQNVVSQRLRDEKRNELEGYVRKIVTDRRGEGVVVPLHQVADYLPNTNWRLAFSTQGLTSELPKDASIFLKFHDSSTLDYSLSFTKTFGLNRLTAKSSYTVDVSSAIILLRYRNMKEGRYCITGLFQRLILTLFRSPTIAMTLAILLLHCTLLFYCTIQSSTVNPGLVTYTYEKITTDVFGLNGIGIGMMGMLQGRNSYINTVYFDKDIWIDQGYADDGGRQYFNVYVKEEEQTSGNVKSSSKPKSIDDDFTGQWDA
jgi:hypothetical protein